LSFLSCVSTLTCDTDITNCFLKMFPDTEKVLADLILNRENDSSGIVDSRSGCGGPHPLPTQLQRSALILLIFLFTLQSLHLLSKSSFCCTFYSQPFNEIFIFSGKSNCCNDTFAIYIAASKENLTRMQIIF